MIGTLERSTIHDYPSMTNGDLDDVVAKLRRISNAQTKRCHLNQEGEFELTSFYDQLQITGVYPPRKIGASLSGKGTDGESVWCVF